VKRALLALLLVGCGSTHFDAPYVGLRAPDGARRLGRVQGNDCTAVVFGVQARDVSVYHAVEHALEGTEATGIVDAEISWGGAGPEQCIEVAGTATRVLP